MKASVQEQKQSSLQTEIETVPVTRERPLPVSLDSKIEQPGLARANEAADIEHPHGTPGHPQTRTVLQQHVDFFDL